MKTYILQHTHEFSDGTDDVKFIGVFSTPDQAKQAIESLTAQPGFKETPTGFHIDEYQVDSIHWNEGFVTG